jgi:hypothetical protein
MISMTKVLFILAAVELVPAAIALALIVESMR